MLGPHEDVWPHCDDGEKEMSLEWNNDANGKSWIYTYVDCYIRLVAISDLEVTI